MVALVKRAEYEYYGNAHYFDVNILISDLLLKNLEIGLYGKNIFNNKQVYPNSTKGGYTEMPGIRLGLKASYSF